MQMINNFGETLRELKTICNMKSITLANYLGYDISYISKWCANKKLPSGRNIIHIIDEISRIFSREIMNNGKLKNFNSIYKQNIINIQELNDYIRTMLEDSYDRSKRNENILKKEENRIIFGKSDILSFVKTRLQEIIKNDKSQIDMYITCDILKMDTIHDDEEFYSCEFPKVNIRIGCNIEKIDEDSFGNVSKMHYLLSKYSKFDIQVYDNREFSRSNIILVKNKFAILYSMDKDCEIDFGVVITNNDALDKIYKNLKSKFDYAQVVIDTMNKEEIEKKKYVFNFYNSDKFQFLFNVNFDYLQPQSIMNNFNIKMKSAECMSRELMNLQEIIEKKFHFSNVNIFIVKEVLDDYIYSSLIKYGPEVIKEIFHRIMLLIKYMETNNNIKLYMIHNDKIDSQVFKYSLEVYGGEHFVMFKKPMNCNEDTDLFYIVKNIKMLKNIEKACTLLEDKEYVEEITAEDFNKLLDKYKKLV